MKQEKNVHLFVAELLPSGGEKKETHISKIHSNAIDTRERLNIKIVESVFKNIMKHISLKGVQF